MIETREQFEIVRDNFHLSPFQNLSRENCWTHSKCFLRPTNNSVSETFSYLFNHFKKGFYVQLRNRRVHAFAMFDNPNYVNNWSAKLDLSAAPTGPNVQAPENWYANNHLVRYEKPFNQSENGFYELKNMFEDLCVHYHVPDVELFINRRDFPLLTENNTEAYRAIHGLACPTNQPDRPALLLSMVSAPEFSDVPMPTPDDWSRASGQEFSRTKRAKKSAFADTFSKDWQRKKNVAVFRGSNTGPDFGAARVTLCELCATDSRFDAKLVSISKRAQIVSQKFQWPPAALSARVSGLLGPFLSLEEQSRYRYIIHMAGHVQSYRLSAELATWSVILLVQSDTQLWFESRLIPWTHYVPVAADLSDLFERMNWCQGHEQECAKIANNARRFYDDVLSDRGCLEYLYNLLCAYRAGTAPLRAAAFGKVVPSPRCFLRAERARAKFYARKNCAPLAIGARCNALLQEIPNFLYTFHDHVERIGPNELSLFDYIKSANFRWVTFAAILKQLALSLAHAQLRCFFMHGQASPENVLLSTVPERFFDYIGPDLTVWRCRMEHPTPIWRNYEHSTIGGEFVPFRDCICLLSKSAEAIAQFQRDDMDKMKKLLNVIFGKTDDMFVTHSYLNPMVLFHAIADKRFFQVSGVAHTNFGKIQKCEEPHEALPILTRYYQQKLARELSSIPSWRPQNVTKGWYFTKYNLDVLNVIISVLTDGSSFALTPEEYTELNTKVKRELIDHILKLGHFE